MTNEIPPLDESPSCECGARLSEGQKLCRKCHAWRRWLRRQALRRRANKRRGQNRRPANRPNHTAEAGVSWA
ncbi:hypothetical protein [Nonomuraea rhizosphaerae]|uniref:hypothetical protein n=1 Tax=Nonomuraea rhizosphaerae TaxID=2665663 RepID=UPI001C5EA014|nr:hypothetical protein [Nonomuraea rhizosphaerae]